MISRGSVSASKLLSAAAALYTPASEPSVKRFYTAGDASSYSVDGSSRTSSIANKISGGSPLAANSSSQPVLVTSSTLFGATAKTAFRSVNSAGAGGHGHLMTDLNEFAGLASYTVMLTGVLSDSAAYGRLAALQTTTSIDYNAPGCFSLARYNLTADMIYTWAGQNTTLSSYVGAPHLFEIVFDGTNALFYVDGTLVGSYADTQAGRTGLLLTFFSINDGSTESYSDLRAAVVAGGAAGSMTKNIRQKLEGWMSWDAFESGSKLPAGHPYLSTDPRLAA